MTEEQIDVIQQLVKEGTNVEWWDSIDGRFWPILGLYQTTGELAVGYDKYMNAQFVIDNSARNFSTVEFYDQSPEDFYYVERSNIFTMKLVEI